MIQVPSVAGRNGHRAEIEGIEARIKGLGSDLRNSLAKPHAKLVGVLLFMALCMFPNRTYGASLILHS